MAERSGEIHHHDLCFGCGQANLFGLQLELERHTAGSVEGRFFVKQDHQGPPGYAHGGVLATALDEAMALLLHGEGTIAVTRRLEVDLLAPAPVGTFVTVRAWKDDGVERRLSAEARGSPDTLLARATAVFARGVPHESGHIGD